MNKTEKIILIAIVAFALLTSIFAYVYSFMFLPYQGDSRMIPIDGEEITEEVTIQELSENGTKIAIWMGEKEDGLNRIVYLFDKEIGTNIANDCKKITSALETINPPHKVRFDKISLKITVKDTEVIYQFRSTLDSRSHAQVSLSKDILYLLPYEGVFMVGPSLRYYSTTTNLMEGRAMPPYVVKFLQYNQDEGHSVIFSYEENMVCDDVSDDSLANSTDIISIDNGQLIIIR